MIFTWLKDAPAVVQSWYLGSENGNAVADILCGKTNPSGKLPFSFPVKLEDNAAHSFGKLAYPGDSINVYYKEDILVGYRWFDTKKIQPMISLLLTVLSGLILFPNSIIHHLVKKYISWFVLQMFFFVVYYIRYYKTDSFDKIESYYLSLPKDKNRRINIVYGLANVLILFSFFLFAFINKGRF